MSPIERLQDDVTARSDAHFPYATVKKIRPRDAKEATLIQTQINKALDGLARKNGKGGVSIEVHIPTGNVPHQEAAGPQMDLQIMLRVLENPLVNMGANGTKQSAEEVVFELLPLFHQYYDQQTQTTLVAAATPYRPVPELISEGLIVYDVFFGRHLPMPVPVKTPVPKIAGTAAEVTITCADVAAVIYYTLDGSYPTPSTAARLGGDITNLDGATITNLDGTAIRNIGSFPVEPGTLVRAVAYSPNKQASNLAAKTIL